MLPAAARLTRRDDFSSVIRTGRRAGRTLVVMHALLPDGATEGSELSKVTEGAHAATTGSTSGGVSAMPQVGFVVSKAVGGSVVRHRVARRLRHVLRERLDQLPPGTQLVVRALPRSAGADSARLGADVDRALRALLTGAGRR